MNKNYDSISMILKQHWLLIKCVFYPAVLKAHGELGVGRARGGRVRADHGRGHSWLWLFPEAVLTEDEVGQVERQTRRLSDPHLTQREH